MEIRAYHITPATSLVAQLGRKLESKGGKLPFSETPVILAKIAEAASAALKNPNALFYLNQKSGGPTHWNFVPLGAHITDLKTGETFKQQWKAVRTDALHSGRRFVPQKLTL